MMDLARFIQIYIVQGLFALFFLYMPYKIIKRGKKRLNLYLSSFYLSWGIAGIINMIYANIFNKTIVYIMHFITYYLSCLSMGFLLIFILILKSDKQITQRIQFFILIIYGFMLLGLLLIPDGIIINESTNWKPNWNIAFAVYAIIVCSSIAIIPITYLSISIYGKFESEYLKKKWEYLFIGIFGYFFLFYGTTFSNALHNDLFRFVWSLISLPCLISLYLIYHGLGRQLE